MANHSYTVAVAKHATLDAGGVDTVTLGTAAASTTPNVEILNRGTSDPIYFTTDGSTPTVAGDNTRVVLPGGSLIIGLSQGATAAVKLTAASPVPYSITKTDL